MKNYDVDYFIEKFEAIPEEKWGKGELHKDGKSCAAGHCGVIKAEQLTDEALALVKILREISYYSDPYEVIWNLNDGYVKKYSELPTPKRRILAALYDIKQNQAIKEAEKIISDSSTQLAIERVVIDNLINEKSL